MRYACEACHSDALGHAFSTYFTYRKPESGHSVYMENHMNGHFKMFAAIALVAPVMAGCASKGFVREHIAAEQVRADAHADSARERRALRAHVR